MANIMQIIGVGAVRTRSEITLIISHAKTLRSQMLNIRSCKSPKRWGSTL